MWGGKRGSKRAYPPFQPSPSPLPPFLSLTGASVALDAAALDRVKKESPTPSAFKGEDEATAGAADASAATACDGAATLTEAQARAVVLARVLSVVNGSTRVR
jgi:hypothetical protein